MNKTEDFLANLEEILDRLGPGAWLHVDETWLESWFGTDRKKIQQAAKSFAERNSCAFIYDAKTGTGRFGRAYFKKSDNA